MPIFSQQSLTQVAGRSALATALTVALAACVPGGQGSSSSSSSVSSSAVSSSSVSSVSSSSVSSSSVASNGCSGVLFCDDFEKGTSGASPATPWSVSGSVKLSKEQAYSGTQSVKVTAAGGGYNRNFMTMNLANYADAQKQMYGRMMVRLASQNANGGDFTMVQADGPAQSVSGAPSGTEVFFRGRVDGRYDHLFSNYDNTWKDSNNDGNNDWSTDCWKQPTFTPAKEYLIPKDKWACVEWHFDTATDELKYWINGNELTQISVKGSGDGCVGNAQNGNWYAPQYFSRLNLGMEQYANDSKARTMYIDDVQVSNRAIGCDGFDSGTSSSSSVASSSSSSVASSSSSVNNNASIIKRDGFEGQSNGAKPSGWDFFLSWQFNPQNSVSTYAQIDTSKKKNGSASVHFKGGSDPAQIVYALPANVSKLYLTAWVNMSKKLGNEAGDNHEHIIGTKGSTDANNEIRFGQIKGVLGTNDIPSDNIAPKQDKWWSGPEITANAWHCIEVEMRPDMAYDTLNAWVDGTLVHTIDSGDDWNNGALKADWMTGKMKYAMFGFHSFSNKSADVWMDDITISTARTGCP